MPHPARPLPWPPALRREGRLAAWVAAGLLLWTLASPAPAQAAGATGASSQTHTTGARKGSGKGMHRSNSSEESAKDRERRLERECRGRPNAGACLGYARP